MVGRLGGGHHHPTIDTIIKDRFLGFLIWQSFQSALVYFVCKTLISPLAPSIAPFSAFVFFQLSLLLFSTCLFLVSSPQLVTGVSPAELLFGLLKLIFVYGGQPLPPDFRRRRPLFFSYKMGVRQAIVKAASLSCAGYLLSLVLPIIISGRKLAMGDVVLEQIVFSFSSFVVFLCWELNCHLLQVFLTRRYLFAPPKGSAAAEMNPSDHLLAALEEVTEKSLVHHLAYLDLCMVSESNVDTWRRAAFFEETGETYKKVIAACLKPLEQLTLDLSEGLGSSLEKSTFQLAHQLRSSTELSSVSRLREPFYDFQVCAWSARIASSLTIRSHKEDRLGVAQLSGCNAATVSTLLACLLAVETSLGKKTNLQPSNTQYTTANIKWAALSPAPTVGIISNKKDGPHYAKAYSMADILRTSIYQIVSNFHHEMVASYKDWITNGYRRRGNTFSKPKNHKLMVSIVRSRRGNCKVTRLSLTYVSLYNLQFFITGFVTFHQNCYWGFGLFGSPMSMPGMLFLLVSIVDTVTNVMVPVYLPEVLNNCRFVVVDDPGLSAAGVIGARVDDVSCLSWILKMRFTLNDEVPKLRSRR
ncbi:hypothetical protein E3N88_39927 [Mikania micrantha]|uniref:Uncharacterized protein n=1 Tax=Mikania micrantha TaxID=192012 RepID=A0A5N6LL64_9ASTR|nr:hypothetical protein E3N88_39927 [Mikania micrantha]